MGVVFENGRGQGKKFLCKARGSHLPPLLSNPSYAPAMAASLAQLATTLAPGGRSRGGGGGGALRTKAPLLHDHDLPAMVSPLSLRVQAPSFGILVAPSLYLVP